MRHQKSPGFFKTSHWAELWQSNVPDLPSLQISIGNASSVAIDAEPWVDESALVAEIALSLICPFGRSDFDQPPKTIAQLRSGLHISTCCIRISGREQGKGRERFHADNNQTVPPEEVESALVDILTAFQATLAAQQESRGNHHPVEPVLIGFDLGFEFRFMSTSYPLITDHFSSWVDLQELVKDTSRAETAPTMRDALVAFGFGHDRQAIGSTQKKHSSALDTLRMTALLVSLVFHDAGSPLSIQLTTRRKWSPRKAHGRYMATGKLFRHTPPKPREFHPFAAQVRLQGSSLNDISAHKLFETFAQYDPIAAGNGHRERREGFIGWIRLPSLDGLNQFVEDVGGIESEFGVIWQAVSNYDPATTPIRTAAELEDFENMRLQEVVEEKRGQRKRKKESTGCTMENPSSSFIQRDEAVI